MRLLLKQFKLMDLSDMQPAFMETEWQSRLAYDQWTAVPVSGSRPPARYKVNELNYIVGSSLRRDGEVVGLNLFCSFVTYQ